MNKIYENLNPNQMAVLAFESCIAVDEVECDHIYNLTKKSERDFITKYLKRLNTISNLINAWGIEYWQTTAAILSYEHLILSGGLQDVDKEKKLELPHKIYALSFALDAICVETGLSIDKVLSSLSINKLVFDEQQTSKDDALNDVYAEMYLNALNY